MKKSTEEWLRILIGFSGIGIMIQSFSLLALLFVHDSYWGLIGLPLFVTGVMMTAPMMWDLEKDISELRKNKER